MIRIQLKRKLQLLTGVFVFLLILRYFRSGSPDWDMTGDDVDIRAYRTADLHDKWIVVTTIQSPTTAIRKLAAIDGWKTVVVGDRRTPSNWNYPGVVYLNLAAQKALGYRIYSYLPYDSYTRKIIGYLYAIEHGAQFIYETDDDNIMQDLNVFHTQSINKALVPVTKNIALNPYPHFGQSSMWPRGYPLENIGEIPPRDYQFCLVHTPAIQQGLVNGDPDVDAIFRMTRKISNAEMNINFDSNAPTLVLPYGVYAPFNSQNTFFTHRAFWALILLTTVSDRETDIYRSYWAQRLLWLSGNNLAFYAPTSVQKRNSWHSNIKDARDETKLYTHMGRYIDFISKWSCTKMFFFDCMTDLTNDLVTVGLIEHRDAELVTAWITDLAGLGYGPPLIKETKTTCLRSDGLNVRYYPWEQNTSMPFVDKNSVPAQLGNIEKLQQTSSTICSVAHGVHLANTVSSAPKFEDVLLIISVQGDPYVIPTLDAVYKIHFPHILYCGASPVSRKDLDDWKVTYFGVKDSADPLLCTSLASSMNYNVAGYLHITENVLLQYEKMHVSSKNKNQIWVSGADLYIFDDSVLNLCGTNEIQCTGLDKEIFISINRKLKEQHSGAKLLEQMSKCLIKAGSDPTFKAHSVTASKEITFYLPSSRTETFREISDYFLKDYYMKGYSFVAVLVMECLELAPEYLHSVPVKDMSSTGHYDYVFPFMFQKVKEDSLLNEKYCSYIDSH